MCDRRDRFLTSRPEGQFILFKAFICSSFLNPKFHSHEFSLVSNAEPVSLSSANESYMTKTAFPEDVTGKTGFPPQALKVKEGVADVERHVRGVVLLEGRMGLTAREQLGVMVAALLFFHTSEFLLALAFHGRRRVNAASTLISGPYLVALACSMVEHALESHFVPRLKQQALVSYAGLAMVLLGETLRKLAVVTANKSFTHDIKVDKRQDHKLVTHGIYRFFRHPSYLGFFIWSIGTQLLLVNPVCTVGYTIVTWRFFDHRIPYEEYFLRRFFGQDYVDYADRVPSGMPFIK